MACMFLFSRVNPYIIGVLNLVHVVAKLGIHRSKLFLQLFKVYKAQLCKTYFLTLSEIRL